MATIKNLYGTAQTLTCTLASLTNNSVRQSTVIDNSSDLFLDVLVQLKIKSGGSGTNATGTINVYAFASADDGTTYTEGAGGSDAAITLTSPTNLRLIGVINVVANSTTYVGGPFSVAAAFGGVMPKKWGIAVQNSSGGTLDATEGNHAKLYQGVQAQTA